MNYCTKQMDIVMLKSKFLSFFIASTYILTISGEFWGQSVWTCSYPQLHISLSAAVLRLKELGECQGNSVELSATAGMFTWSGSDHLMTSSSQVIPAYPYILAMSADSLEVRSQVNGALLQSINLPKLKFLSAKEWALWSIFAEFYFQTLASYPQRWNSTFSSAIPYILAQYTRIRVP